MSVFLLLVRDRRLWLLGLVSLLAFVLGRVAVGPRAAIEGVIHTGYWVMLITFVFFIRALVRLVRATLIELQPKRAELRALVLVGLAGSALLAHEKYGFKILADEVLLVGTSMGIHQVREVAYPFRASNVQGPFLLMDRALDKRPFFYPFVVSLAHDFTGYRPENAFYVNTALGFVFLGLVYLLIWRIAGSRWAGALGVLLFAGLPLLAQQMKGGGFELLNLVMLALTALLCIRFAERRDEVALEALVFSAVLLAFTRYESVVVLLPVALLACWGWWRERRVILTWPVIFSPLVLTLYLLRHTIFVLKEGSWELASQPGATTPFGLHYLPGNLAHALAFFFDLDGHMPNSPFFAALGLAALPFFLLWVVRSIREVRAEPWRAGVVAAGGGLAIIAGLLMVYFWGQFDHPVIHRLSLPVHLLMAVAIAAAGRQLVRQRRGWQVLGVAALAALVCHSLPVMSRRAYAATYSPAVEMEWRGEFLQRYPERDYLFLDNDSAFWVAHRVAATPITQAQLRKTGLAFHLRNHSFSAVYVFQRYHIDPETGRGQLDPADDLGGDFELEPVWERRIQTLEFARISRVVAIGDGDEKAVQTPWVTPSEGAPKNEEELAKVKKDYVENWVKQLP